MLRAAGALASFATSTRICPEDASNDNLWKLKPKMHSDPGDVRGAVLSRYPREYWTCRDESFMGGVLSMAHSRGGSATASTILRRGLDTHPRALALKIGCDWPKK